MSKTDISTSIPVRYIVCFVTWFALLAMYMQRVNLSVAILSMASQTKLSTDSFSSCIPSNTSNSSNFKKTPFSWTQEEQGWILSSFLIGYLTNHFLGAILAMHYGGRCVLLICLLGSSVVTLLLVPLAYAGFYPFLFGRVLIGFFCGPLYPVIHQIIGIYALPSERTKLTVFTHTGSFFIPLGVKHTGNIAGLALSFGIGGFLVNTYHDGWKYLFYLTGSSGILATMLWAIFVYSSPESHRLMNKAEKELITKSVNPNGNHRSHSLKDIPYKKIFTSVQIYILSLAHFGKMMVLYAQLMGFPKFLNSVYGLSKDLAGYYSIVPFMADFIFQLIYPYISDYLKQKSSLSLTNLRKLNSAIGFIGTAAFLIPVGFFACDDIIAPIAMVSLSLLFIAPNQAGYFTSIIEISPPHAGISMGIINTFGSLAGVIQLQIVSAFTKSGDRKEGYKLAFILTAIIPLVTGMIYVIFGTSERQNWDTKSKDKKKLKPQPQTTDYNAQEVVFLIHYSSNKLTLNLNNPLAY